MIWINEKEQESPFNYLCGKTISEVLVTEDNTCIIFKISDHWRYRLHCADDEGTCVIKELLGDPDTFVGHKVVNAWQKYDAATDTVTYYVVNMANDSLVMTWEGEGEIGFWEMYEEEE